MRVLLAFTLALLAGCSGCGPCGDATPLAGQDRAVAFIWTAYSQTKPAPVVYWRRDSCNAPNGIYGTLPHCTFVVDGVRMAGVETDTDQWIEVGAPSNGFRFSDTALAHELLHAAIGDPDHLSAAWQRVTDVDQSLKADGL